MSQEKIDQILKNIGIDYDAWSITKIIIENDMKMKEYSSSRNDSDERDTLLLSPEKMAQTAVQS
ncbi:MAG: hypothetical protein M1166_08505 [Candidatus Thermoplasmatota archaeon]|nr:hypothetical protein [Candidatus Thermoplasmatota archaeon]